MRPRALGVGGVGLERPAERLGRARDVAEFLSRLGEGEPRPRPVRRQLERLGKHLRRGRPVAVLGGGLAVGGAARGDEVAAGEGVGGVGHRKNVG